MNYQLQRRYRNTPLEYGLPSQTSLRVGILDGTSPSTAMSVGRYLLSSWTGPLYVIDPALGGAIAGISDQTGHGFSGGGASGNLPQVGTTGPNNVRSAAFDGVNNVFAINATGSQLITPSDGWIVISCVIKNIGTNNASTFNNDLLIGDAGEFWGFYLLDSGVQTIRAYNWDGADHFVSGNISLNTAFVFSWRHQGGNIFLSINGAAETSAVDGDTTDLTTAGRIAGISNSGTQNPQVDIVDVVIYGGSSVPDTARRTSIISNFMSWIGAV